MIDIARFMNRQWYKRGVRCFESLSNILYVFAFSRPGLLAARCRPHNSHSMKFIPVLLFLSCYVNVTIPLPYSLTLGVAKDACRCNCKILKARS